MLEHASGYEGTSYLLAFDEPVTIGTVQRVDSMVARRLAGEPLQYVLGRWAFRGLDVMVDRRALIPRPETEQVVEVAIGELLRIGGNQRPTTAVDLGTGTGVIAMSIATEVALCQVWAVERSTEALEVARANLAGLGRAAERLRLVEGDWFEGLPDDLRKGVDVMVANPPYIAERELAQLPTEVADWEPTGALIAGPSGLEDLRRIVEGAPSWLADGGALVLECGPHQVDHIANFALSCGFDSAETFSDLANRQRGISARIS